ncbi:hypothetical protein ACFY04_06185 [Streptomyces sp. NPDC001549]|uniref:hypothetical protein n=1 Tax=Streptomyces sp. NPDC001549 TaxID=3364586 RepID=UPI00369AD53C
MLTRGLTRKCNSWRDEQGACSQHIETAIGRPLPYERVPMEAIRAVDERFASAHEWLNECGYRADVAATRRIHPAAMDFRTWLEPTGAARIVAFLDARRGEVPGA